MQLQHQQNEEESKVNTKHRNSIFQYIPAVKETAEAETQTDSEPIKQLIDNETQTGTALIISTKTQTQKVDFKSGGTQTLEAKQTNSEMQTDRLVTLSQEVQTKQVPTNSIATSVSGEVSAHESLSSDPQKDINDDFRVKLSLQPTARTTTAAARKQIDFNSVDVEGPIDSSST